MPDSPEDDFGQGQSQPDDTGNAVTTAQTNAVPAWCPPDRKFRNGGWCGRPERTPEARGDNWKRSVNPIR